MQVQLDAARAAHRKQLEMRLDSRKRARSKGNVARQASHAVSVSEGDHLLAATMGIVHLEGRRRRMTMLLDTEEGAAVNDADADASEDPNDDDDDDDDGGAAVDGRATIADLESTSGFLTLLARKESQGRDARLMGRVDGDVDGDSSDSVRSDAEGGPVGRRRTHSAALRSARVRAKLRKVFTGFNVPVKDFAEHFHALELRVVGHSPAQGPSAPQISAPL